MVLELWSNTEKKKKFPALNNDNGIQKSYQLHIVNAKLPKLSKRMKTGVKYNTYEAVSTFSFSSTAGTGIIQPGANQLHQQVVGSFGSYGTNGALINISNLAYSSVSAAFSGQNPNNTILTQASNAFLVLKALSGSFEITNQQQSNLILRVYVCLAKKDQQGVGEFAQACWDKALDEKAGGVRGTANTTAAFPDAKPMGCGQYFSERWKIIKTKYIELPAGFTHKMNYTHIINKIIPYTKINSNPVIADVTVDYLFTMRGTPINKTTAQTHAAATNDNVVFGPSKIIGIGFQKYTYKPASIDVPIVGYQDNFVSTTAPPALWEVNDESGIVKNIFPLGEVA